LCTQTQLLDSSDNSQVLEKEWAKRHRKKQKKKGCHGTKNSNDGTKERRGS